MSSGINSCLYHSDKVEFDNITKELRKSKWIPKSHVHRLAMAVCSCRKVLYWDTINSCYADAVRFLEQLLVDNKENECMTVSLQHFIKGVLADATPHHYSCAKFLCILYKAKQNNFEDLGRGGNPVETIDSGVCVKDGEDKGDGKMKSESTKRQRLTAKQLTIILKKKKKKKLKLEQVLKLDLFPGNWPHLKSELGGNLQDFGSKNKCILEYDKGKNKSALDGNTVSTYVRVFCENPESLTNIRLSLTKAAEKVQTRMDIQRQIRKQRKRHRCYLLTDSDLDEDESDYYAQQMEQKAELSRSFDKKHFSDMKNGGKKAATAPVLQGGHCLHCLQPFQSLKNSDNSCVFHRGFTVQIAGKAVWSCCDKEVDSFVDVMDDHKNTGCCKGRHIWRVHKKANRKPKLNTSQLDQKDDGVHLRKRILPMSRRKHIGKRFRKYKKC